jgi:aldehyde:ferredoxin oxidoreductase
MLREYYEARDWDPITGRPSYEKLLSLGLEEMAENL